MATGARVIVVFEGRAMAGKGGVTGRVTQRFSPRVFRHVALPAPTKREKNQLYAQRYMAHVPTAGEIMLSDRSWYKTLLDKGQVLAPLVASEGNRDAI